jgi:hypothetical protein
MGGSLQEQPQNLLLSKFISILFSKSKIKSGTLLTLFQYYCMIVMIQLNPVSKT